MMEEEIEKSGVISSQSCLNAAVAKKSCRNSPMQISVEWLELRRWLLLLAMRELMIQRRLVLRPSSPRLCPHHCHHCSQKNEKKEKKKKMEEMRHVMMERKKKVGWWVHVMVEVQFVMVQAWHAQRQWLVLLLRLLLWLPLRERVWVSVLQQVCETTDEQTTSEEQRLGRYHERKSGGDCDAVPVVRQMKWKRKSEVGAAAG